MVFRVYRQIWRLGTVNSFAREMIADLIGTGAFVVVKTSRKKVLATNSGAELEEGGMTKRNVEEAVSVGQEPSDKVYEEIIKNSK